MKVDFPMIFFKTKDLKVTSFSSYVSCFEMDCKIGNPVCMQCTSWKMVIFVIVGKPSETCF